jgi:hypothetical protein
VACRLSGKPLSNLGRCVLPHEAVAAAPNGGVELREVDLERAEDLLGVVLGSEQDLPLAAADVLDDVLSGTFGVLGDLLLRDQPRLALACLLDDPLGLAAWPPSASPVAP